MAEETSNIESDSEEEPPHRRRNNVPQALIEGNPPQISSDSSGEEEEGDIAVVPPSVTLDSEGTIYFSKYMYIFLPDNWVIYKYLFFKPLLQIILPTRKYNSWMRKVFLPRNTRFEEINSR